MQESRFLPREYGEMIDHDRLFKELLTTFFVDFLQLFAPELGAELDPGSISFLDKELFSDVDTYLRLDPTEALQFDHQADMVLGQLEKEKIMELTTSWKEEGRAEGKAEGRMEGEMRVVLRLLERRCGSLPSPLLEQVRGLSSAQLEDLAEALLEFNSATDLDRWFHRR